MITLFSKNLSFSFTSSIIPYTMYKNINTILNKSKYSQKYNIFSKYKYTFLPKNNFPLYYYSYDTSFKNNFTNIFKNIKRTYNNNNIHTFVIKSKEWVVKNKKKIIITSSIISIVFILVDVKLYLNRKKVEKEVQKKISDFLKDENPSLNYAVSLLSQNYIKDNFRLLVKNFIENYNKNESKEMNEFCYKIIKNKIIEYIKNSENQKFFAELIKNYILNNINRGINIIDLCENIKKNKSKTNYNLTELLETCLVKVFTNKKFIDYISTNLLNELKFEIKPDILSDEVHEDKGINDKEIGNKNIESKNNGDDIENQ